MAITFLRSAHVGESTAPVPVTPVALSVVLNSGETGVLLFVSTGNAATSIVTSITGGGTWTQVVETDFNDPNAGTPYNTHVEIWTTAPGAATATTSVTVAHTAETDSNAVFTVAAYSGVLSIGTSTVGGAKSTNPTISLTTQDANNVMVGVIGQPIDNTTTLASGTQRDFFHYISNSSRDAIVLFLDATSASPATLTTSVTEVSGQWAAAALELRSVAAAAPWTTTAATFFDAINEKPPAGANDADYIQSPSNANASIVRVGLEPIQAPGPGTVSIVVRHKLA